MVPKCFLLLIVLNLTGRKAIAQFSDTVHHYISYSSTGTINKTNDVSSYVLNNSLRFNVKKETFRFNSTTSWLYGGQQNKLTNNDYSSSLDFNKFKKNAHIYYWGLANYVKSYSLKINNRLQAGIGVAYNVIDSPKAWLNISDGIVYETSSIKLADNSNDNYQTFRNSLRLRHKFVINDIFTIEGANLLQNSLSEGDDYIIQCVNTMGIKLRKWLSLTSTVNYNKNKRTRRENLLITFGLSAEKYF